MLLLAAHTHRLVVANARHIKSSERLQDLTDEDVLDHLIKEVCELCLEPEDIDEMGDILCCIFHFAHRRGWSAKQMEEAALRKLAMRFSTENHEEKQS